MFVTPFAWFMTFVIYLKGLDEVLCYIRESVKLNPSKTHSCAVLDSSWSQRIKNMYENKVKDNEVSEEKLSIMLKYFAGVLPDCFPTCWDEIDFVYAPYFVSGNHWVALQIDLQKWVINVYDCNVNLNKDKSMKEELKPVMVTLPSLVSERASIAVKYAHQVGNPLGFHRVKNVPQNKRT